MNQIKIGRFIAECRKKLNLTQMQLAEKLDITDKAVSKWERGVAMPDTSIMLELCDILCISVNELLYGEKIIMENTEQKEQCKRTALFGTANRFCYPYNFIYSGVVSGKQGKQFS